MIFNNKSDILKVLADLDFYCKEEGIKAKIVMLGGSAILTFLELNEGSFRPTRDIDINIISVDNRKVFVDQLSKVNIDLVGGVMEVPPQEDLEEEKNLLEFGLEAISVYLPDLELLACCKIFSTREKDLQDLERFEILDKCNKVKLLKMVEEYKTYLLNPTNPDLNIHQLDRIFSERGI